MSVLNSFVAERNQAIQFKKLLEAIAEQERQPIDVVAAFFIEIEQILAPMKNWIISQFLHISVIRTLEFLVSIRILINGFKKDALI